MSDWASIIKERLVFLARYLFDEIFLILPYLKIIENKDVPTLGVMLKDKNLYLFFNPDFLNEYKRYLDGLILHEALHILLHHINKTRFNEKFNNKNILNIASDLIINEIIYKTLGENSLPDIGISFNKIQNMLAEHNITIQRYQNTEYYYEKIMELSKFKPEIQDFQLMDDHSGLYDENSELDIDMENLNNDNLENQNQNNKSSSSVEDRNSDLDKNENENENENKGHQNADSYKNKNKSGSNNDNNKSNENTKSESNANNNDKNTKNSNSDISDLLERISGGIANKINSLGIEIIKNKTDFDFIEVIKKYIKKLSNEYKIRYTRLNKRSLINMSLNLDTEIKLKKIQKTNGNIIVALDTSGSMIEDVEDILNKIFSTFIKNIELPFTIKYIEVDDKIQYVEDFNKLNKFLYFMKNKNSYAGSGGTNFNILFDYLIENENKYDLVLFFTDGVSEEYDRIFNLLNKYPRLQFIFLTIGNEYKRYIGSLEHPRIKIFDLK